MLITGFWPTTSLTPTAPVGFGSPAINPEQPDDPVDGMVLYILNLRAYTHSTDDVVIAD